MSPSSGYTGPTYYGGFEFSSSTVNGIISREGIRNYAAAADPIYYQSYNADGWEGSELSLHLAVLFKQEDWLSGHQAGANAITGLSMHTNAFSAGTGRFLVQVGGDYYVSNSTGLGIDAFSVSGTTIPEPSSMAVMLGLVGLVMSGYLRRRHI